MLFRSSLLKIIKTRLEGAKRAWPEELQNVIWAYRTITRVPTREIPFRLTFGTEVVILMEVGLMRFESKLMKTRRINRNLTTA